MTDREAVARVIFPVAGWDKPEQSWMDGARKEALTKADAILNLLSRTEATTGVGGEVERLREELALSGDALRSARDFANGLTTIETYAQLAMARRDIGFIVRAIDATLSQPVQESKA